MLRIKDLDASLKFYTEINATKNAFQCSGENPVDYEAVFKYLENDLLNNS